MCYHAQHKLFFYFYDFYSSEIIVNKGLASQKYILKHIK